MGRTLPAEVIAEARELRRLKLSWGAVAKQLGLPSQDGIRRHLDPVFRARRNAHAAQFQRERYAAIHGRQRPTSYAPRAPGEPEADGPIGSAGPPERHRPSPEMIAERDRVFSVVRNPITEMLGDPLPGRSALDRRQLHQST